MNYKYLTIGIIVVILLVICYTLYIKTNNTQENLSMGTLDQLYARDQQDLYLTTDPVPYDPWMYNPLSFWNMSTRRPYSMPYYLALDGYYRDGILI